MTTCDKGFAKSRRVTRVGGKGAEGWPCGIESSRKICGTTVPFARCSLSSRHPRKSSGALYGPLTSTAFPLLVAAAEWESGWFRRLGLIFLLCPSARLLLAATQLRAKLCGVSSNMGFVQRSPYNANYNIVRFLASRTMADPCL